MGFDSYAVGWSSPDMSSIPYIAFKYSTVSVVSISCGDFFICVLFENKRIFCWGSGSSGALGQDSTSTIGTSAAPISNYNYVSFSNGDGADKLSAGFRHVYE